MVRTFLAKKGMDLQAVAATLLDARFGDDQRAAAVEQLRALNPHADLDNVGTDTVLLLPDTPAFKASVADSASAVPVDGFRALLASAFDDFAKANRSGNAARAAARSDVAAALKGAAFKRASEADKAVAAQGEDARKALAEEEKADKAAADSVAALNKAALDALAKVTGLLGAGN